MADELAAVADAIEQLKTSIANEIARLTADLSRALAAAQAAGAVTAKQPGTDLADQISAVVASLTSLRAQVDAVEPDAVAAGNAPAITVDTTGAADAPAAGS